MYAVYHERVWLNWWFMLAVIIVVVASSTALMGRGYLGYVFERPPMPILFVFLILDVIFVFIALNFRKVEIKVDQKYVRVSYGILKTTIPAAEICNSENKVTFVWGSGVKTWAR